MGVVVQVNSIASTQIRAARVEQNRRVIVTDMMSRMMFRQLHFESMGDGLKRYRHVVEFVCGIVRI